MSVSPWTFEEATLANGDASREQEHAETVLGEANRRAAQAEETYRKLLALEMWRLRQDGVAWSTLGDLARGAEKVAEAKRLRDAAEGEQQIASHAVFRLSADRRAVEKFIDWSTRRDLAEGNGRLSEPDRGLPVIGQRAA